MKATHHVEKTAIPVIMRHAANLAVPIAIVLMEEAISAINVKLMSMAA
jgi:hypothetical protein